jgi:hypothetical protein
MATRIEQILADHVASGNLPDQPILFISDPNGDTFVLGYGADKFEVPPTGTGELTTAQDLLDRLDFEVYDSEPTTFVAAADGTFIRI